MHYSTLQKQIMAEIANGTITDLWNFVSNHFFENKLLGPDMSQAFKEFISGEVARDAKHIIVGLKENEAIEKLVQFIELWEDLEHLKIITSVPNEKHPELTIVMVCKDEHFDYLVRNNKMMEGYIFTESNKLLKFIKYKDKYNKSIICFKSRLFDFIERKYRTREQYWFGVRNLFKEWVPLIISLVSVAISVYTLRSATNTREVIIKNWNTPRDTLNVNLLNPTKETKRP